MGRTGSENGVIRQQLAVSSQPLAISHPPFANSHRRGDGFQGKEAIKKQWKFFHCFLHLHDYVHDRQEDGSRYAENGHDDSIGEIPGHMGDAEGVQQVEKNAAAYDISHNFLHRMDKEEKGNHDDDDTGDAIASEGSQRFKHKCLQNGSALGQEGGYPQTHRF